MNDSPALTQIHTGVTFGFNAPRGYFSSELSRQRVDQMTELNVGWVCLVPTVYMESFASPRVFCDFENTPSDVEIADIIEYVHRKGMRVYLRPMIECYDGHGRTQVTFPGDGERIPGRPSNYWSRWFASMEACHASYARLAQSLGVEMYCLDSELDKTVYQNEHWKRVLSSVREVYSGPVDACFTLSVDFLRTLENPDHWWHQLDSLSCSAYFGDVKHADATVQEIADALQGKVEWGRKVTAKFGKRLLFGECGCTSSTGGAMSPSSWSGPGKYAPHEQANYLDAICRVFSPEPWWAGLYWWKWDEQSDRPQFKNDPAGDKGFTIHGKPGADVMGDWFGRLNCS